jgi:hypothetical protein
MVKKIFTTLSVLAILAVSLAMVSAAASENNFTISINGDGTSSSPVTGASGDDVSFTIDFASTNSSYTSGLDLNWSGSDISSGSKYNVGDTSFSPTIQVSSSGSSHILKVTVSDNSTGDVLADLSVNIYYEVESSSSNSSSDYADTACYMEDGADNGVGDVGDLEISDFDVENNGDGKDAKWEYFDSIEVEVEVKNTGDEDVDDVVVQILILDSDGKDVTNDFDMNDDEEDLGDIKDGKEDDTAFTIDVPIDVEAGDYELYVFAYSEDEGEDAQCASMIDSDYSFSFSVESIDDDEAIDIDSDELGVSVDAYCGQNNLEIIIPIYNLADEDEEDLGEYVLVTIYNNALGIDEYFLIEDLDGKEDDEATFYIDVPEGLDNDKYDLDINVYFDFDGDDDDDEQYEDMYYDEEADYSLRLNVIACQENVPTIVPNLESSVVEGEELVVSATVSGGDAGQYSFGVSGYESWAELVSVSPESVYIAEDGSATVEIILIPTTSGTESFQISATVSDETYNQPVTVSVKEGKNLVLPEGMAVYLIAGIGGLLILILLVLVIKVAKKRPVKAQF